MGPVKILAALSEEHGWPEWWSEDPYTVIVQSVLVQRTAWKTVSGLCDRIGPLSPAAVRGMGADALEDAIRPCGFASSKTKTILALTEWFSGNGPENVSGKPTENLRSELLSLKGVGRETADVILLYAYRRPVFIVDAYTRRLMRRLGWDLDDEEVRRLFRSELKDDVRLLGACHRLILDHCIVRCADAPECDGCPLGCGCASRQTTRSHEHS